MIAYDIGNIEKWMKVGPRKTVGEALYKIGEADHKLVVACADCANRIGLQDFVRKFPNRFLETGIAEQSMIGAAAGLACEGFHVCATAYAPFASLRILEQIRVYAGYMRAAVTIIGLSGGLAAGDLGATHTTVEDIAALRAVPNLVVISPADCVEEVKILEQALTFGQPVYIRIAGSSRLPMVYHQDYVFEIGKAVCLREGQDVAIIASGAPVYHSLKAAELLAERGISCEVLNMHTIKPLDCDSVERQMGKKLLVTVEEHNIIGGLGAAVAEHLSQHRTHPPLLRLGVSDEYYYADTYQNLLEKAGLTAEKIVDSILTQLLLECDSESYRNGIDPL